MARTQSCAYRGMGCELPVTVFWSADVRNVIADQVGSCLAFNVRGNNFRLICRVAYANRQVKGTLFVEHFLTHAEPLSRAGRYQTVALTVGVGLQAATAFVTEITVAFSRSGYWLPSS